MKKRGTKIFLILVLIFAFVTQIDAQVTIGSDGSPEAHALLQLKDKDASQITLGGATVTTGGLLLPRVELQKRYELLPFAALSEVGTSDYENIKKPAHTGLMVYNLLETQAEDLFVGVNVWDGEKWNSLTEKLGVASGTVSNCDSVTIVGQYLNKTALGSGNYLTIPMHITKPGTYTVTAIANPDNGYYFVASGVFMTTGYYYLTIPGAGSPTTASPTSSLGDEIIIKFNDVEIPCSKNVFVEDSSIKPEFTMNCSVTKVNGVYLFERALDGTNTVSLTLTASAAAVGASYIITTDEVGGIKFSGAGILSAGKQTITLQGNGTPVTLEPIKLTITSNSSTSSATCSATIPVAYTRKRILTIGSDPNGFGYNFNGTAQSGRMLRATNNYGTLVNSIVKCEGFDIIDGGVNPSTGQLQGWLTGVTPVDIVITGYANTNIGSIHSAVFKQYLENGGVVLVFIDEATQAQAFLRGVLGDNSILAGNIPGATPGMAFRLSNIDHEILNGPFGDIRGLQWGEDASSTQGARNLPVNDITIFSTDEDIVGTNVPVGAVTSFVHNTLNLLYVGDGGFNSSNTVNATPYTICPFRVDANNAPVGRIRWGRVTAGTVTTYNSVFTANAIAWAIKKAQFR